MNRPRIIRSLDHLTPASFKGLVIALGNFDGIHLGHRKILEEVRAQAKARQGTSAVMSFSPHPSQVVGKAAPVPLLCTDEQKISIAGELGIELFFLLPFTKELAETPARSFVETLLVNPLSPAEIIIGHDFAFGRNREGTPEYLEELAQEYPFKLTVIDEIMMEGKRISSTRIRKAIAEGKMEEATRLFGSPYRISGRVVEGRKMGRSIGFPTANLATENELLPLSGVYAGRGRMEGRWENALINVGFGPTLKEEKAPVVEAWFPDLAEVNLYGRELELAFLHRLRQEKKFASAAELIEQIGKDLEEARRLLARQG